MDDDNLIYVKFRYTFNDDEQHAEAAMPKISELLGTLTMDQRSHQSSVKYITIGVEQYDKCGENTKKHVHMHMLVDDRVDRMRRRVQRYFVAQKEKRKGNVLYSLTEEEDVKDIVRFFRYVFKQSGCAVQPLENRLLVNHQVFPPDFDKKLQCSIAYEEWLRDCEFNMKKKNDALKPSTKDMLFEYLDKINETVGKFKTKVEILTFILQYYMQEEKSANQATIMGYLNTAVLRYGLMTPQQMAESWLK